MKRYLTIVLAIVLCLGSSVGATSTNIRSAKCAEMVESDASSNFGSTATNQLGNYAVSDTRNPIMAFDISGLPVGQTINSATLWLYNISELAVGSFDAEVAAIRRVWVETEVTWNVYSTGNSWTTGGAENTTSDRYTPEDTSTVSDVDSVSWDVTDMVTNWYNSTWTNNGLMINPVDAPATEWWVFHSDDAVTEAYRPNLVVDYSAPAAGSTTVVVKGVWQNNGVGKCGD